MNRHDAKSELTIGRQELLVDGSDSLFRSLVHNLFAFLNRHETIRSGHGRHIGLAGIEYTILISISHLQATQEVNVKTISDHLHVTGAFVTRMVNKLVDLGLVEKQANERDKRRVSLTVTPKGRDRLRSLAPIQRKVNDVEFASLSRSEFLALTRIVEKLVSDSSEAVALQAYLEKSSNTQDRESTRRTVSR